MGESHLQQRMCRVELGKPWSVCQDNLHMFILIYSYLRYSNIIFAVNFQRQNALATGFPNREEELSCFHCRAKSFCCLFVSISNRCSINTQVRVTCDLAGLSYLGSTKVLTISLSLVAYTLTMYGLKWTLGKGC